MVKVKRLHEDAIIPQYAKLGDSGFDLVAVEDVVIKPGETKVIHTGLAFEIPPGYEIQIRSRSGTSRKTKLRVVLGTIDSGYRGEVGVIVDNVNVFCEDHLHGTLRTVDGRYHNTLGLNYYGTYIIRKGDKIAQGVLAVVGYTVFEEVEGLSKSKRGESGFGSTGMQLKGMTYEEGRELGQTVMDEFIAGIDFANGKD
ncbi:dUTP diphosphatase [Bacillus cereus]|uniref:dUTP diphosphatase n=1 Tax=Bacillus cereus TaxID=1396 RepID=UPI000BEE7B59|nr:deoxyuridine 5'-triphosphate nucleotidohydrolase [Bacillus cereus]PFV63327.1 deoxyuridine 5'-triphosphate nucleotidohydrolase [Bacillus cereus]PGY64368.1 deoxyuridine 5'-triphosphate nucleotidohydrolase [Bacillus cereus]